MAIDNVLRISVRIDLTVGDTPFAMADLSLPAWSSLAEILDEVLELTRAPFISRPWVARTATGIPIDPGIPLSHTQLEQGGVLVLSPERDLPAPVIRDSAEALVELSSSTRTTGLVDLLSLTGVGAMALLLSSSVASILGVNIRMALLAAICTVVFAWLPRTDVPAQAHAPVTRVVLPVLITGLISTGAALSVTDRMDTSHLAWALLCASGAGLLTVLLLHLFFRPPLLSSATLTVVFFCLLITAAGIGISRVEDNLSGPAALTIASAVIMISFAPKLAASLAGLRVPNLPTAGQDLSVSDNGLRDPTACAGRAQILYSAQVLALTLICSGLIIFTAHPGTWFSTLFACTTAIAALLHSIRQDHAIPTWSLMVLACAAVLATIVSATRQEESWAALVLGVVIACITITVAIWVTRIPPLEPTTIVWLERIESLCVAATLPLALHLLDVFGMLRTMNIGLGG